MVTEPGRGPAVAGLTTHTAAAGGEQQQLFSDALHLAKCAAGRMGQGRGPAAG
jgi:hypothetical protein